MAVSGGSDSLALLHLMAKWGKANLIVATVDHGLRPEAAAEAEQVKQQCQALGIDHETLVWSNPDATGNLQDRARQARYALLSDWARRHDCEHVALGHTMDDVAETFIMRLGRRSGVDGLAAMRAEFEHCGVRFHRPLLGQRREALQSFLRSCDINWLEDPSNDDPRFERVRIRQQLGSMGALGIDAEVLSAVAHNMSDARDALELQTQQATREIATHQYGDIVLDPAGFEALPTELRRRVLVGAIKSISGAEYGPRRRSVAETLGAIAEGQTVTICGCLVIPHAGAIHLTREYDAVKDTRCTSDQIWDHRWQFDGPHMPGLTLRALGEAGLQQCADWRATQRPRAAVLSDPGLWRDDTLIAAPTANMPNAWQVKLVPGGKQAVSSVLSH